jgi:hypothetical protein
MDVEQHHSWVKAKDEATRDGTTDVKVRAIEIAEESQRGVHPNICLAEVLEDCQRNEGVVVEVRHDKVEEYPRVPCPPSDDLVGVSGGGAAVLVFLIRNIGGEPLKPLLCVCTAKREEGFLRTRSCATIHMDLDLFGPMVQQRWGTEDCIRRKCKGEEDVWCDSRVAKGQRMPLDHFKGNLCGPIVPSTPALTTSCVPHELNVWQLTHYAKRFPIIAKIEVP